MSIENTLERIADSLERIADVMSEEVPTVGAVDNVGMSQEVLSETAAPAAPAAPAAAPAAPAPAPPTTAGPMAVDDAGTRLSAVAKRLGGGDAIFAILKEYSVTGLAQLDPSHYADVVAKAEAL